MTAIFDKLSDTRKEWLQRGNEIWMDLQTRREGLVVELGERRGRLVDAGQGALAKGQEALTQFEHVVLHRTADLLAWAYSATGERSEAIRKSFAFINERLEDAEAAEVAESFDPTEPPFPEYLDLNVKKIAARLEELSDSELEHVLAFEGANKNRKTVIQAAKNLLADR